jgi:hypothetical protein
MAVGDIVNGIGATGSTLTFQPAVSVSIAITSCGSQNNLVNVSNGIIDATFGATALDYEGTANVKVMINNAVYLSLPSSANNMCYSGIQIK